MKFWQPGMLNQIFYRRFTIIRWLMTLVLVLTLASCGEKASSQEVAVNQTNNPPKISQISQQFSEVSPPEVIQELRLTLENYRPQVTFLSPQPDEILQDSKVTVNFQVKDIPIFKDPELELGPHLHVILDNQPYIAVYDVNKPLVLPEVSPGTHTLRVFASRPWHESFKNEGAYAQTTFHIFTKTEDNNPDPTLPVLTYSRPKGSYGAEPILLDFYLTNAPLHLVAEDNPNDTVSDWRIRCTINDESFILDRWQPIYLKGFKPGKNWIKLEFLDNQGNPLKNAFNTTARLINYQPQGKDTLSRIVRGELKADQARSIVDPNYTANKPVVEPTPTPSVETTPESQPQIIPKTEVPETPVKPTPQVEASETSKSEVFFKRRAVPTIEPSPSLPPTLPEIIESPAPEAQPEIVPTPPVEAPEKLAKPETPKSEGFFQRRSVPTTEPSPSLSPTLPEIIESPAPEAQPEIIPTPPVEAPEKLAKPETPKSSESTAPEAQPEETPTGESIPLPTKIAPDPEEPSLKRYFNPKQLPNFKLSPSEPSVVPETTPVPEQEERAGEYKVTTMEE
ncbi:hypothetical protein A2T98_18445 [Nodularia spumigena CENA596]|uniref:FHA domain containing protein n=1 Tax=Nodularia spumigena CENA596 TaxID=1819295 RepID=A0A166IFT7_NODSP|nr:hypothetical protein [Nodularia spumigena]KZL48346.1 hypothetical protein A2T98_18445 [Nodularia spumigena CENA596]